jgi:hypothetical protein
VCDIVARLPQVRRPATERLIMTADEAVELLIKWMRDPEVSHGVRAKIAQDLPGLRPSPTSLAGCRLRSAG